MGWPHNSDVAATLLSSLPPQSWEGLRREARALEASLEHRLQQFGKIDALLRSPPAGVAASDAGGGPGGDVGEGGPDWVHK